MADPPQSGERRSVAMHDASPPVVADDCPVAQHLCSFRVTPILAVLAANAIVGACGASRSHCPPILCFRCGQPRLSLCMAADPHLLNTQSEPAGSRQQAVVWPPLHVLRSRPHDAGKRVGVSTITENLAHNSPSQAFVLFIGLVMCANCGQCMPQQPLPLHCEHSENSQTHE